MKHDYKFRVDAPLPTEDETDAHRNFDAVFADYHRLTQPIYRRPLYRNPKAFIGLILILVIGYLVFEAVDEERRTDAVRKAQVSGQLQDSRVCVGISKPVLVQNKIGRLPDGTVVLLSGPQIPDSVTLYSQVVTAPRDLLKLGLPTTGEKRSGYHVERVFIVDFPDENWAKTAEISFMGTQTRNGSTAPTVFWKMDKKGRQLMSLGTEAEQLPDMTLLTAMLGEDAATEINPEEVRALEPRQWYVMGSMLSESESNTNTELVDEKGEWMPTSVIYTRGTGGGLNVLLPDQAGKYRIESGQQIWTLDKKGNLYEGIVNDKSGSVTLKPVGDVACEGGEDV